MTILPHASLCAALLLAAVLAGCSQQPGAPEAPWYTDMDDGRHVPSWNATQPASATGLEFVAQLGGADGEPFPTGAGNWVQGDYVYGSALQHGFFIADVSDPAHPVLVYNATEDDPTHFARKAQVVTHPDGRLTLALATQTDGLHLWNVTDPRHPEFASRVELAQPNHNLAWVPGTELVFNNPSGGVGFTNELIDVSDPYGPAVVGSFGTHGCHGTTFRGAFGGDDFRAFCAAIQRTEVWDLTGLDPATEEGLGITLAGVVEFPASSPIVGNPALGFSPVRTLHHHAMDNEAGDVLVIGDEHNGGGNPGACGAYDPATGASTPFGALWFYDISDIASPQLRGWLSPPAPPMPSEPVVNPGAVNPTNPLGVFGNVPNCTAHFGTLVPGEEKLVMAWYSAGVLLVEFTDPAHPAILAQYQPEGVNTWNARVHNGYVFTGDIARGMDVLKLV